MMGKGRTEWNKLLTKEGEQKERKIYTEMLQSESWKSLKM